MNSQTHHQQLNEKIARLLAIGCLAVLILRLLISPLSTLLITLSAGCLTWMTLLYLAVRKEILLEHAPHAIMYSVVFWLIAVTLAAGGLASPVLYSYALVPMVSGLLLPRGHTIVITVSTILLILLLVFLPQWGIILPVSEQDLDMIDRNRTLWLVTSLIISACVALYFAQQNSQLAATLRDEARIDFLTRIPNRRGLEEELRRQQESLSQSESFLSVLMIDIDHFKRFNDQYGHTAGDHCLTTLSSLLRVWASSHRAFIGRYGGEEFMMIMADADPEESSLAAETIRQQIENQSHKCVPKSGPIKLLTVTIGVSSLPGSELGKNFDSLIEAADQALYLGKAQGRNRVVRQSALPFQLQGNPPI